MASESSDIIIFDFLAATLLCAMLSKSWCNSMQCDCDSSLQGKLPAKKLSAETSNIACQAVEGGTHAVAKVTVVACGKNTILRPYTIAAAQCVRGNAWL